MSALEVQLYGQTTANIRSLEFVDYFVDELKILFPSEEIFVEWTKPRSSRLLRAQYVSLSQEDKKQLVDGGVLGFSDSSGTRFLAGYQTYRISAHEWPGFVQTRGYVQNEITISVASSSLSLDSFRENFAAIAKRLAVKAAINFLRIGGAMGYPKISSTRLGLGAGLPGVYWVNVYGPPFVRIIGVTKLTASRAFDVQEIGPEIVYIRVSREFSGPLEESSSEIYDALRAHIGKEYFINPPPPRASPQGHGAVSLLRFLWQARAEHRDDAINAQIRPEFDWTQIIVQQ